MSGIVFQIGKNGVTQGSIDALALALKNRKIIRISLLSASGRDREKTKIIANEICDKLSVKTKYSFTYSIIGFKIILRRHSDTKRPKRKPL